VEPQGRRLWGCREEEARGQHFLNLDIGLPVAALRKPLLSCLANENGAVDAVVTATDRRGRPLDCRVRCANLLGPAKESLVSF